MEGRTQDLPTWILRFISPTRIAFERTFLRHGVRVPGWTISFLFLNLGFLFAFPSLHHALGWFSFVFLWALPFSRIVEIAYAFYNDAIDQLEGLQPRSGLTRSLRIKLLGCSYFETAVCYASLYSALPNGSFHNDPTRPFEFLYFSWVTITTTGFGDIYPLTTWARAVCMSELAIGLMLIVFGVGAYFSYQEEEPNA
jgi:hypothetical protein